MKLTQYIARKTCKRFVMGSAMVIKVHVHVCLSVVYMMRNSFVSCMYMYVFMCFGFKKIELIIISTSFR